MEARDFCVIFQRMLERFCDNQKINYLIINESEYEIVFRIEDLFKNWKWMDGIHKIVRVSPFGKKDKVHTSLCKIVIKKPIENFDIQFQEKDLRIDCFKSTGPGGQHRNKTMSAIRITHIPTKTVVVSCAERSQHDNKRYAYEQLMQKLSKSEENLLQMKKEEMRKQSLEKLNIVLAFYFNHHLVVNESNGKKTDAVKKVLNGELNLVL